MRNFILILLISISFISFCSKTQAASFYLSNGNINLSINGKNGAIDSLTYKGNEFYNLEIPVSDWGMQLGSDEYTFKYNSTNGYPNLPVSVISGIENGSEYIKASGSYNEIYFSRTYYFIEGMNTLRTYSSFVNNSDSDLILTYFDTFDPDQAVPVAVNTYNDVIILPDSTKVATATDIFGKTVLLGTNDSNPNIKIAAGYPFQINNPEALNEFINNPYDGNGEYGDYGIHIGFRDTIKKGDKLDYYFDQTFGETPEEAILAYLYSNNTTPVPEPSSMVLGFLGLASMLVLRRRKLA